MALASPPKTAAHAVGAALAAAGVDTAFGLVGSGNLVVTNALVEGGARFHAARHEAGATAMADGWSRVTGRVGAVSVHQGPGLTNTMTALAEAVKSRTPLLVLAGETPAAALRSNFRIDQHALVESVGAVAHRVSGPASAAQEALLALRRAEAERRPVVLMLPIDVQAGPAEPGSPAAAPAPVPAAPAADPEALREAARLLGSAERPVLIGGRGAVLSGAREAIEALGERCGALLATSAVAHGLFTGLPYAVGISGGFASPTAARLLRSADVIVAFGATLNHWTTRHGNLVGDDARLVQVDLDPAAIGAHRPVDVGLVADAAAAARALDSALEAAGTRRTGFRSPAVAGEVAGGRWRDEPYEDASAPGWIDPRTLSIALSDLLPGDAAVAVDSGHFTGWPSMYLDVADARDWIFANGFQAVGLGLGCAIGAAVARPGRVTVAAIGDGGAFLALQELETAARLGLRLLVVIYDDAAYGAEVHHFRALGERVEPAQFPDSDLAGAARALGAGAVTVRAPGDLAAVRDWLATGSGPLVVDAKVDPDVRAAWLEDAFRAG
jgi:thiamine pyrophosphate-dependent acetolactate synthase large subunit-like protein